MIRDAVFFQSRIFTDKNSTSLLYLLALSISCALYYNFMSISLNTDILFYTGSSRSFNFGIFLLTSMLVVFSLYANKLFLKQHQKKIALLQLSGLRNWQIFVFLLTKNLIIWLLATILGIFIGILFNRLLVLFLLWLLQVDQTASFYISLASIVATIKVFFAFFLITLFQTCVFLSRAKLLDLLQERNDKNVFLKLKWWYFLLGLLGIIMIILGYYLSTFFLRGLSTIIIPVLLLVIVGTLLFYRYSFSFFLSFYRYRKNGCLSLNDIIAWVPFSRQIKKQAFSMGFITILTAITLTVLSLGSITYYSIQEQTENSSPYDFVTYNQQGDSFEETLAANNIRKDMYDFDFLSTSINKSELFSTIENVVSSNVFIFKASQVQRILPDLSVSDQQIALIYLSRAQELALPANLNSTVKIQASNFFHELTLNTIVRYPIIPSGITNSFIFAVSDTTFNQLADNPTIQQNSPWHHLRGYNLLDQEQMESAISLYNETTNNGLFYAEDAEGNRDSMLAVPKSVAYERSLETTGGYLFIVLLLSLSFLTTTTWILFFKQLAELENELMDFKSLIQIGFPKVELMKAIYLKETISFGIPLLLGICHSFFAVRAGWIFFGDSLYEPFLFTILCYCILYGVFAYRTIYQYQKLLDKM